MGEKPAPTRSIIIFPVIKIQKKKGKRKRNIGRNERRGTTT
jgi:hypothetical protein